MRTNPILAAAAALACGFCVPPSTLAGVGTDMDMRATGGSSGGVSGGGVVPAAVDLLGIVEKNGSCFPGALRQQILALLGPVVTPPAAKGRAEPGPTGADSAALAADDSSAMSIPIDAWLQTMRQKQACSPDQQAAVIASLERLGAALGNAPTIVAGAEPYVPGAGRGNVSIAYYYQPFNRRDGGSAPGYHTGLFDVSLSYSPSDWAVLGITLPFVALARTPQGEPERETGFGDVRLGLGLWFNHRDLYASRLHYGLATQLVAPSGKDSTSDNEGTGLPVWRTSTVLKAAYLMTDRLRLHASVGPTFRVSRGSDHLATDATIGLIWNQRRWPGNKSAAGGDVAFWADLAASWMDGGDGMPGFTTWEARGGAAYLFSGAKRRMLSLGLSKRLDDHGLHSEWGLQAAYGCSFGHSE